MDQEITHYASENLPLAEDHVDRVRTGVSSVVIDLGRPWTDTRQNHGSEFVRKPILYISQSTECLAVHGSPEIHND